MKGKNLFFLLILFFLCSFGFRLFFIYNSENFAIEKAYFNLKEIESIKEKGFPDFYDEYSYGGRVFFYPPGFNFIMAYLSYIFPLDQLVKIFPAFLASLIVFVVYAITYRITKNEQSSLLSSFLAAFVPVWVTTTLNHISEFTLFVPLIFYISYCLIRSSEKNFLYQFIVLSLILPFINIYFIIFTIGYIIYFVLSKMEKLKLEKSETEVIIFVILYSIWIGLLLYKNLFLLHQFRIFWQNTPSQILATYFKEVNLGDLIVKIGVLPTLFGLYTLYKYLFTCKNKVIYIYISHIIVLALGMWLKLIELDVGMVFLGISFCILFGLGYKNLLDFIKNSKFDYFRKYIFSIFIFLILITTIIPVYAEARITVANSIPSEEIKAMKWIELNTEKNATILGNYNEGFLISAVAKRKNFIDSNFIGIKNINQRFDDLKKMYKGTFKTEVLSLMEKYKINYVILSNYSKEYFNITELSYAEEDCFELVFNEEIKIYKVLCVVEKE